MTQKILKIVFILLVMLSFCISYVYATDINLNLPGVDNTTVDDNSIIDEENFNNIQNSTTDEQDLVNNEDVTDITQTTSVGNNGAETLQASNVSTAAESGLGITNIINILLITVGVVIILLAIAIIIRLKS